MPNTRRDSSISWIASCNLRKSSLTMRRRSTFCSFRHLPANLVASFAKRLARLALLVPQNDQRLIITFISNLVVRHPTIRVMIDRQETRPSDELYSAEELDPNKSNAIESSLWEIEVNHIEASWVNTKLSIPFSVSDPTPSPRCRNVCLGIDITAKNRP